MNAEKLASFRGSFLKSAAAGGVTTHATRPMAATAGDVFWLEGTDTDAPHAYVVVMAHPLEPDHLFAMPADQEGLCGPDDFPASSSVLGGPLTVRCGLGAWLSRRHFSNGRRIGKLPKSETAILASRTRWLEGVPEDAETVRFSLRTDGPLEVPESDEDYRGLMDFLGAAVATRAAVRFADAPTRRLVVAERDFQSAAPTRVAMAARGENGPRVAAFVAPGAMPRISLASPGPGRLEAVRSHQGVKLMYTSAEREAPPDIEYDAPDGVRRVAWRVATGGTRWQSVEHLPLRQGQVALRLRDLPEALVAE